MKKLLLTSAIAIALSVGACGEQKTAEQLLISAEQYSQQGNFSNAIIDYKNAIRLSPQDANARLGLGRAYIKQGNYISAEKELERAVELGISFSETASLLTQVKTRLDKFSDVEQLVKASEDLNDDDYIVVLTFAGMSGLSKGEITKAQDYFAQAAAINKDNKFSQLAGAYLLYSERKLSESLTKIDTLLLTNEGFSEAIRLKGYIHFSLEEFDKAIVALSDYLTAHPFDYQIEFFQVNALMKAGQFEQANTLTNKLLKHYKNSPLALQYKAQIEYQAGNYVEAREYASQAVGIDESFFIAKTVAGVSSYKLDELEQAYDYLIGLENLLPANHPINVILLSIKIKLGYTDDLVASVDRLNTLKASDSDSDLLQLTSLELMKLGDYQSAQSLLNKVDQINPNNAQVKVQQGALLMSQGDLSGIDSLEQALTLDPSLHETEFALARQYIQSNEIEKVQAIATKWLASEEYKVAGYILSGMLASKQEKENEAEAFFKQALTLEEDNISALYSLAAVYEFKKQTDDAISGYQRVIELNPNHYNAIRRYSILQSRKGNTVVAISFLSGLHDQHKLINTNVPKNLVMGLAQVLTINAQNKEGIELLETLKNYKNLSERYWAVLAETYMMSEQYSKSLESYEQGIKAKPNSYLLIMDYIGALDKLRKYPQALIVTLQANQDFPNDDNLMVTLAYLELVNNNIKAAKSQLNILKKKQVSNDLLLLTEAHLAITEKDYDLAIGLYREVYAKTPIAQYAIYLSRALEFSEQWDKAEKILENYLSKNSNDNQVRMLLAELYSKHNTDGNRATKIINTYQAAVEVQPKRVDAINNLAWQQYLMNDFDNAIKNIKQAITLDPKNIALQETYGVILVADKQFDDAIPVLSSVLEKGSVDVYSKVSLAEAYIAKKQLNEAKKLLTGLSAHDSQLNLKITELKQAVMQ